MQEKTKLWPRGAIFKVCWDDNDSIDFDVETERFKINRKDLHKFASKDFCWVAGSGAVIPKKVEDLKC